MAALKLTRDRQSVGVVLPKEILAKASGPEGDMLYAVETQDGIMLDAADPEFAAQMDVGRRRHEARWRDTLRALAK